MGVSSFAWGESLPISLRSTAPQLQFTGILTLQPTSRPRSKAEGLVRHQLAMGFGLFCMILGTSAIIVNKNIHNNNHFVSAHAVSALRETNISGGWNCVTETRPVGVRVGVIPGFRRSRQCMVRR